MCPLRACDCTETVTVAATSVLQYGFFWMRLRRFVTVVGALAETAGMRRRGLRLHRHRNNCSEKRDQQQKSGSNPLHAIRWIRTPN